MPVAAARGSHDGSTNLEHQSNIVPWLRLQEETGVKVLIAPANANGLVEPEAVVDRLSARTRLVTVTHVSNVLGTVQPEPHLDRLTVGASAGPSSLKR